jgi:SAM-dependent methyltransferase
MRALLQKYLLIPRLIWFGINAPKDQKAAWNRYWSSVKSTGRDGEAHWDAGSEAELGEALDRVRTHMDLSLPILDLGCGNGRHSRLLAKHFPKVLGVDVSPQAIEKAVEETSDREKISYRVLDLAAPGAGKALASELGAMNVYIRGVLHVLDPESRAVMVENIWDLLGEKGMVFLQETNYSGNALNYLSYMGATFTHIPTPLKRALASGIRKPDHFGDRQLKQFFPASRWHTLESGETVIHTVPVRGHTAGDFHPVPAFFALVRRRASGGPPAQ